MATLIVTEAELRACLPLEATALAATERGFVWLEEGRAVMPPVMHIEVDAQSAVDTKGAHVTGTGHLAVKIATGFFGNPARGLPSCSSIVALIDAVTGRFDCLFLDNGYLMDLRTGLAGAVAARYLAPGGVETVGVIGTGVQARYQMRSLALVRRFGRLLVLGRDPERVAAYCAEMAAALGVEVVAAESAEALVRASQVVVTTTQATAPLVRADWLHPGLHITAMGSDLPGKQEIEAEVLRRADLVVCDSLAQCRVGGELQHVAEHALRQPVRELGAFAAGRARFVNRGDSISLCDLTGTGVQDAAIAQEAYRRVRAAGLGTQMGAG